MVPRQKMTSKKKKDDEKKVLTKQKMVPKQNTM